MRDALRGQRLVHYDAAPLVDLERPEPTENGGAREPAGPDRQGRGPTLAARPHLVPVHRRDPDVGDDLDVEFAQPRGKAPPQLVAGARHQLVARLEDGNVQQLRLTLARVLVEEGALGVAKVSGEFGSGRAGADDHDVGRATALARADHGQHEALAEGVGILLAVEAHGVLRHALDAEVGGHAAERHYAAVVADLARGYLDSGRPVAQGGEAHRAALGIERLDAALLEAELPEMPEPVEGDLRQGGRDRARGELVEAGLPYMGRLPVHQRDLDIAVSGKLRGELQPARAATQNQELVRHAQLTPAVRPISPTAIR
jgi:hypothetical protein